MTARVQAQVAPDFAPALPAATLQRSCACGENGSVSGKCPNCTANERLGVQPKLTINPPGDRWEQEADRIADQVVSDRRPALPGPLPVTPLIQRQAVPQEEEEDALQRQPEEEETEALQTKPASFQRREEGALQAKHTRLQRQAEEDQEEEHLQAKASGLQRQKEREKDLLQMRRATASEKPGVPDAAFSRDLSGQRSGGSPLDPASRAYFEPRFGHDLSAVRLHSGPKAADLALRVGARAFTHGSHIFFGAGELDTQSLSGKRLLAHELAHTLQQSAAPSAGVLYRKPSKNRDCTFKEETPTGEVGKIVLEGATEGSEIHYETADGEILATFELIRTPLPKEPASYNVRKDRSIFIFKLSDEDRKRLGTGFPDKGRLFRHACDPNQPDPRKLNYADALTVTVGQRRGRGFGNSPAETGAGEGARGGAASEEASEGPEGTAAPGSDEATAAVEAPLGLGIDGQATETSIGDQEADGQVTDGSDIPEELPDNEKAGKLGALVTTDVQGSPEAFAIGGKIENFREKSRTELRKRVRDVAVSTLSHCFDLGRPSAEIAADSPNIKLILPRFARRRAKPAQPDAATDLPVMVDMEAIQIRFVDELQLSPGNVNCDTEEKDCFFGGRICIPRLNISVGSIETAEDATTALDAADAVVAGASLGAPELIEEGGEFAVKQMRRIAKRHARRGERKASREARKQLRKATRAGDVKAIAREKRIIEKRIEKNPNSFRPSTEPGYDVEIKVGLHTYRRKVPFDGTWCRFSKKKCGIRFSSKVNSDVDQRILGRSESLRDKRPRAPIGSVAEASLKKALRRRLSPEAYEAARLQLRELASSRKKLIPLWNELMGHPALSRKTKKLLRRARNSIRNNMKPSDLTGALRDKLGIPVRYRGAGVTKDHLKEVSQALRTIRNTRNALLDDLERAHRELQGSHVISELSVELNAIGEFRRRVIEFLETR